MADEIQFDAGPQLSGATLYYLLRNQAAQVFDNGLAQTFTPYVTANYANYDIPLVEQGTASGYYVGNVPTDLAAGLYFVSVHQRAGVSPAEDDTRIGVGEIDWSGAFVRTLSTVGVSDGLGTALLDLADGVEDGMTLRQTLRLIAAALAGKRSNVGTATEQYDAIGIPGTPRVVGNLDASGNGTPTLTP